MGTTPDNALNESLEAQAHYRRARDEINASLSDVRRVADWMVDTTTRPRILDQLIETRLRVPMTDARWDVVWLEMAQHAAIVDGYTWATASEETRREYAMATQPFMAKVRAEYEQTARGRFIIKCVLGVVAVAVILMLLSH